MDSDSFTFSNDSTIATSDINTESLFENSISLDSDQHGGSYTDSYDQAGSVTIDAQDLYAGQYGGDGEVTIDTQDLYSLQSTNSDTVDSQMLQDSYTSDSEQSGSSVDSLDLFVGGGDGDSTYTELSVEDNNTINNEVINLVNTLNKYTQMIRDGHISLGHISLGQSGGAKKKRHRKKKRRSR